MEEIALLSRGIAHTLQHLATDGPTPPLFPFSGLKLGDSGLKRPLPPMTLACTTLNLRFVCIAGVHRHLLSDPVARCIIMFNCLLNLKSTMFCIQTASHAQRIREY